MELALLIGAMALMTTFGVLLLAPVFCGRTAAHATSEAWTRLERDPRLRPNRFRPGLRGDIAGLEVRAQPDGHAVRIEVGGLLDSVSVASQLERGRQRMFVGHPEFDRAVVVGGSQPVALARFDGTARAAWLGAMRRAGRSGLRHVQVEGGVLTAVVQGDHGLDDVLALAEVLRPVGAPLAQCLADRWGTEPVPDVRFRILAALLERFHGSGGVAERTAHQALDDPDVRMRFLAARHLQRYDVLATVVTEQAAAAFQVEAALLMRACPHRALALQTLQRCAEAEPIEVRTAAARLAGALGGEEALAVLDALLSEVAHAWGDRWAEVRDLALATARSLASLEVDAAIPALTTLLGAPSVDARVLAAEGLSRIGDSAAADRLRDLADDPDPMLRYAVRSAIRSIRSRTGHPEAGAMSLAELPGVSGALSIVSRPS